MVANGANFPYGPLERRPSPVCVRTPCAGPHND